ncbi:MAG: DUF4159 domain-containing protein [Vicinamibacterales bacterium]
MRTRTILRWSWPVVACLGLVAAAVGWADRTGRLRRGVSAALAAAQAPARVRATVPDDGRYTFVRLRWRPDGGRARGFWSSAWDHDYPRAEQHLVRILAEVTLLDVHLDGSRVLTLDDPDLFRYPIAFMWEPGFWTMSDAEALAFRAYLLKGGFAIFEDFDGPSQWANFEAQIRRVIPGARFVRLTREHPLFRSFFEVRDLDAIVHPMNGMRPSYLGVFEDNDPARRLLLVANFDNDVPEYWEWSGQGLFPFDASNEAYKLGVNYVVYGYTH